MTYTEISILACVCSLLFDRYGTKTLLISRKGFWVSYAIILPFQLLTNWWLTSRQIVMYNEKSILGIRLVSAPVEDLFFGFSLILSVLSLWIYQEERNR